MTVSFGTRNLYVFADEARELHLADVLAWEERRIDIDRLGIGFEPALLDALNGFAVERVRLFKRDAPEDFDQQRDGAALLGLLGALQTLRADDLSGAAEERRFGRHLGAQDIYAWIGVADTPAESFHEDDYPSTPLERFAGGLLHEAVDVTVSFECLGGVIRQFAADGRAKTGGAALSLPADGLHSQALPVDRPLPILRHFIGAGGVGPEGWLVNFDARGQLAHENPLALPLLRAPHCFVTFYAVVRTTVPAGRRAWPMRAGLDGAAARTALREAGFEPRARDIGALAFGATEPARWELWQHADGADVVHLYEHLPGNEAGQNPVLPLLALAVRAGGAADPAARAGLAVRLFDR